MQEYVPAKEEHRATRAYCNSRHGLSSLALLSSTGSASAYNATTKAGTTEALIGVDVDMVHEMEAEELLDLPVNVNGVTGLYAT
jgi:hypothetical protein